MSSVSWPRSCCGKCAIRLPHLASGQADLSLQTIRLDVKRAARIQTHKFVSPSAKALIRQVILPDLGDFEPSKKDIADCKAFLSSLPNLESLRIDLPDDYEAVMLLPLTSIPPSALKNLRRLSLRAAEDNPLLAREVTKVLRACKNLEKLELSCVESDGAPGLIKAIHGLGKLQELDLDETPFTQEATFVKGWTSSSLRVLRINPVAGALLPAIHVHALASQFSETLKELVSHAVSFDEDDGVALPSFDFPHLQRLNLTTFETTLPLATAFTSSPLRTLIFSCIMGHMEPVCKSVMSAVKQHQSTLRVVRLMAPLQVPGAVKLHKMLEQECKKLGIEYKPIVSREDEEEDGLDDLL